jgi:hypothetical protein
MQVTEGNFYKKKTPLSWGFTSSWFYLVFPVPKILLNRDTLSN